MSVKVREANLSSLLSLAIYNLPNNQMAWKMQGNEKTWENIALWGKVETLQGSPLKTKQISKSKSHDTFNNTINLPLEYVTKLILFRYGLKLVCSQIKSQSAQAKTHVIFNFVLMQFLVEKFSGKVHEIAFYSRTLNLTLH